jgi:hypothetical protein
MNKNIVISCVFMLSLATGLVACGRKPAAEIQPAQAGAESFKTVGDYEMHYNALRTDQLTTDIARAYGIERSKNKVMLNVSVLHRASGDNGTTTASDAEVVAAVHNLNGQTKDLTLRRVTEANAIYFIGDVGISGNETLVFEIKATPTGANAALEATLTREFFSN